MNVFGKFLTKRLFHFPILGILLVFSFVSCAKDHLYPDHPENPIPIGEKHIYVNGNDTLRYQLISPEKIGLGKKYPLLLFCHGADQRGNDNESQLGDFPELLLTGYGRKLFPCYILAPQVPFQEQWVNVSWQDSSEIMPDTISNVEMLTIKLLDSLRINFHIDTNRIYVTGLSMGGFATWDLICRYPQKFAAAAPIAGGGDENQAAQLIDIPIWAFHGDNDDVILPCRSINMVNAVNAAGGNARLTLYPNVGHWSWNNAYKEPELFRWMFEQSK